MSDRVYWRVLFPLALLGFAAVAAVAYAAMFSAW